MAERETADVEDSQNWDLENPVKAGPVKNRRTVVSVSFPSSALQVVAAAADEAGLSTSQFIREAALAKASPAYVEAAMSWAGGTAPVVMNLDPSGATMAHAALEPIVEEFTSEKAHVYTPA